MEKRWSERRELRVGVEVYRQGSLLGSCCSHDIGLGGAYLELDGSFNLQKDMDVELVFSLQHHNQGAKHKINARVARSSGQGAGLKFCDFDTGVFRSLQEIMAYKMPAGDSPHQH
jgi:hypothetical protein